MPSGESSITLIDPDSGPPGLAGASMHVSFVMPCLDEAETVAACVREAKRTLDRQGWTGEVIVADNGSADGSQEIAALAGAVVVHVEERGYGAAIRGGVDEARGTFVVIGDADGSYDFTESVALVEALQAGADVAIGSRFRGDIQPGAMPPLHRHLGNPVLSRLGRALFRTDVSDFHCGLRAGRRDVLLRLPLMSTGMEFATEMIVRAVQDDRRLVECPVTLRPDGRTRNSHLRPWRDGWRHLRLMVLLAPTWTLVAPGVLFLLLGLTMGMMLFFGEVHVGRVRFGLHTLACAGAMCCVGLQTMHLGLVVRMASRRRQDRQGFGTWIRALTRLESCLAFGVLLALAGIAFIVSVLRRWSLLEFGDLPLAETLPLVIAGSTLLCMGVQVTMTGVFADMIRALTATSVPRRSD